MTASNRALVRAVTDHYTLRREYPAQEFRGRTAVFAYLLDHMESCSMLAQKLGLITYRATRTADGRLYADDHEGATGYLLTAYARDDKPSSPGKRVVYVEGTQHGLFDVGGRGVAVVDYRQKTPDKIEYTRAAFVKVDNVVLAALAQLFSVFLRGTVDSHFTHVLRNPVMLSEKAATKPQKLLDTIARMSAEDQKSLATFTTLVRSNAIVRAATRNQVE
ncbi:MAG TPA: hypothetical protein VL171_18140 [Verrucomicrobiae bacterium]|nr:hypothetical protein [Verrucomicrobiae bacterium]